MTYASLNLLLPKSAQSDKWAPHAAVALAVMGAVTATGAVNLDALTDRMSVLAGEPVARASSNRGVWVLNKAGHLATTTTRKGWYVLSESGVEFARRLMDGAAPAPKVEVPVTEVKVEVPEVEVTPAPEVEVTPAPKVEVPVVEVTPAPKVEVPVVEATPAPEEAGVVWLPPVSVSGVDAYGEDEYLTALAAEQTPCFGAYSPRAEVCGACPVSGACSAMLVSRMSMVVVELEAAAKREEEAKREAAKREEGAKREAAKREEEAKELNDILFPLLPSEAPTPVSKPVPTPFTEITAAFPGLCSGCKGKIERGSKARFLSGKGMFHPACLA